MCVYLVWCTFLSIMSIYNLVFKINGSTEVSTTDIRKELFEGDNIVTGKTDYGLSEVVNKNNNDNNDDESKE